MGRRLPIEIVNQIKLRLDRNSYSYDFESIERHDL